MTTKKKTIKKKVNLKKTDEYELERLGNWYLVKLNGKEYNVVVVKEDSYSCMCDPSSLMVFDENFNKVKDYGGVWDKIENLLEEKMIWEDDMLDDNED